MARMGFLFLILAGILAIILIARLASKTRGKGNESDHAGGGASFVSSKSERIDVTLQKGLVSLLLKKKVIGEEELLEEINRIKNDTG